MSELAIASKTKATDTKPEIRRSALETDNVTSMNASERSASCACGGGCPACQIKLSNLKVSQPSDPAEIEADQIADKVMRMPVDIPVKINNHQSHGPEKLYAKCDACEERKEEETETLQRKETNTAAADPSPEDGTFSVKKILHSGGSSLDLSARSFFEPRFGSDLSHVRIHTDSSAGESARLVNARAYTIGSNIVFGNGEYRPDSDGGRHLLAHELAHVRQQKSGDTDRLHRTPANKVSCANHTPLVILGTGVSIADPVGVITAAENRANQMFDDVISALDAGRQRILAGAPAAWPTITDALALGLQLMGLDPEDPAIWTAPAGTGRQSVPLLLRRLRMIRSTIGAGSFFFFCLGTGMRTLGNCGSAAGNPDICTGAEAATCAGEFFTAFCPGFWTQSAEMQAATLVHETSHNFATFIGHTGRFTNAECFARLIQVYAGVPVAEQRLDLCPDP